jgi:acetylornithine deacetylase/succinyl-diaminopimelate desuccinylase-like protein
MCSAVRRYGFATCSTLKPTQWSYPSGSINQIPGSATISGDMRVTPFYDVEEVRSGAAAVMLYMYFGAGNCAVVLHHTGVCPGKRSVKAEGREQP